MVINSFISFLSISILLLSLSLPILSLDPTKCTAESSGKFFDLSPIAHCTGTPYTYKNTKYAFDFNICSNLANSPCSQSSSVCQQELDGRSQYSLGSYYSSNLTVLSGGNGVLVEFTNGDYCAAVKANRKTLVSLVCNQNEEFKVMDVKESPICTYNIQVETKYACPVMKGEQKVRCMEPTRPVLNAFLVPHSHDDVGWLETIDGYYNSAIKHVLDTVVENLMKDSTRRFIYVEQAYFHKWWTDPNTSDQQRANLKTLLKNKQFEFIIGGWVMQDEACTTYSADIDQMTEGHQFILETFGSTYNPVYGWQIDPFGASTVTPTLESMMGFKGHIIQRINWFEKNDMKASKGLVFEWIASQSLGNKSKMFTHVLDHNYCQPMLMGFDFEHEAPVTPQTVAAKSQALVDIIKQWSDWYQSPNILLPWGCDFHFVNATEQFYSMDQIVKYIQAHSDTFGINIKYSLLSDWYQAVINDGIQYPTRGPQDFLPYADNADSWWSGYFTSRQALKILARKSEAILRTADHLYATINYDGKMDRKTAFQKLDVARMATSETQHHDGITGTEKNKVAMMYNDDMEAGNAGCVELSVDLLASTIANTNPKPSLTNKTDDLLNIQNGKAVAVVVYNSLGWTRKDYIELPLNRQDVTVQDSTGSKVPFQINPTLGDTKASKYTLFIQVNVAPLGFETYFVVASGSVERDRVATASPQAFISNDAYQLVFSDVHGRLSLITNKKAGLTTTVDQNAMAYTSYTGDGQKSGAYIFRPAGAANPLSSDPVKNQVQNGPLVNEIYQTFPANGGKSYWKQWVRLYNGNGDDEIDRFIQIKHEIGVLPGNTEVITRFSTNISSSTHIFTDDNGMETLQRTYDSNYDLKIPGNFFPFVYWSYLQDPSQRLTLLTDASRAVSSQNSGQIEAMMHRRILVDDGRGVGEPLNDTHVIHPEMRVLLERPTTAESLKYKHTYLLNFPPSLYFSPIDTVSDWTSKYTTSYKPMTEDLPPNVHLLSLKTQNESNKLILRLHHLFGVGEDPKLSSTVTVDVTKLFKLKISSFQETTLTANKAIGQPDPTKISLSPKSIRTFLISFE